MVRICGGVGRGEVGVWGVGKRYAGNGGMERAAQELLDKSHAPFFRRGCN